jgi:transcriptional regulator with XRE-family HTH domain
MHLGELITRLRHERGLTQRQLALKCGFTDQTLAKQEKAETRVIARTSANALWQALQSLGPITQADQAALAEGFGFTASIAAAKLALEQHKSDSELVPIAHRWLHELLDWVPAAAVCDILAAVARSHNIPLSDRQPEPADLKWLEREKIYAGEDGLPPMKVKEITPVIPPPAPPFQRGGERSPPRLKP